MDQAILQRIWAIGRYLDEFPIDGMVEYVTGFTTITIFFDPLLVDLEKIGRQIDVLVSQVPWNVSTPFRTIEIPICYGEEFGPDLSFVAKHNRLSVSEVIEYHTGAEYRVYLIGFAPGFPYLGGMSPRIATPRLESPRVAVPAGSVGIAGEQTGIYPLATPGGWQLIGRTPLTLFRPADTPPCLLSAGDRVLFRSITRDQFAAWPESG
jgi:inhibitor of KinA